jgi:hypothetical protein
MHGKRLTRIGTNESAVSLACRFQGKDHGYENPVNNSSRKSVVVEI